LSLDFGDIIMDGKASFSIKILDDIEIIELKLYLMCIDDSSLIFVFSLDMFSINNFSGNLFNDNN
jgi:hypothetical protein